VRGRQQTDAVELALAAEHVREAEVVAHRRHEPAAAEMCGRRSQRCSAGGLESRREPCRRVRSVEHRETVGGLLGHGEAGVVHAERFEDPRAQDLVEAAPSSTSSTRPRTSIDME
jgi:hypothetical protein